MRRASNQFIDLTILTNSPNWTNLRGFELTLNMLSGTAPDSEEACQLLKVHANLGRICSDISDIQVRGRDGNG